jgi:hypothetical protein
MTANPAAPNIDYARLHELSNEFTQHWSRLQAFYLDAVAGFAFVLNRVEAEQAQARAFVRGSELDSQEFQDTRMFSYADIFSDEFCTSGIQVRARNAPGGANYTTLGQLCVIAFYDFWEDYLRPEYAIAKGVLDRNEQDSKIKDKILRDHASHDLWGDLYYLRTSIVHNRGYAISAIAKCKLIKWYNPGDPIAITPERMRQIFLALLTYRNELFREQFPEQHIML